MLVPTHRIHDASQQQQQQQNPPSKTRVYSFFLKLFGLIFVSHQQ
jgi:hypothetical protein